GARGPPRASRRRWPPPAAIDSRPAPPPPPAPAPWPSAAPASAPTARAARPGRPPAGRGAETTRRQRSRPAAAPPPAMPGLAALPCRAPAAGGHGAVAGFKSQPAGARQQAVEIEADGGPGALGHFVLERQIKVIGAVAQPLQRAFVLGEHRGADAGNVVEINTAQSQVAQVFAGADLPASQRGAVGLVGPAEKAGQPAGFVLEGAGALQMLPALGRRFIEADHHGGGG